MALGTLGSAASYAPGLAYEIDPSLMKRLVQERNSISGGMPDAPVCQSLSDAYARASDRADALEKAAFRLELIAEKLLGAIPSGLSDGAAAGDPSIVGAMYCHAERLSAVSHRIHQALDRIDNALGLPR